MAKFIRQGFDFRWQYKEVAVKVLRNQLPTILIVMLHRFQREACHGGFGTIQYIHIVRITDIGEEDGQQQPAMVT